MSDHELEPLSPLASALLGIERRRPDAPEEVVSRVYEALAASVASGADAATARMEGQEPPVPEPRPIAPAMAPHGVGRATTAGALATTSARSAALLAAVFLAGAGVGAGLRGGHDRSGAVAAPMIEATRAASADGKDIPAPLAESFAPREEASPGQSARETPPPRATSAVPASTERLPPKATAPSRDAAPSSRDSDLAAERVLVQQARVALARGENLAALDAAQQHAREFPRGRLREEREAIAIQALAQAGETGQAQTRAALFREAFPASVFLPAVEAAVSRR